jgi:hypothetical protein
MRYIEYLSEADALTASAKVMNRRRKPGNPDGDGKPYTTRYAGRVATDGETGQSVLSIRDEDVQHLDAEDRERVTEEKPITLRTIEERERDAEPTDDGGRVR